ncbi:hypothetical protein DSM106972_016630 [Dulcicalothrix desertica PCC 7102]|uniref:Uncharacterized protein n=1 Tax=Dulcicalothrix desertica PCC 7102 TaxID=232991 RepID=A0A3S1J6B1_9CYAN|nr:hypothetical protein [Dulcicalothrix desertica]RUT08495.1 hypothetical protein DSM106972_016630 [Dulcicalothrix desertica PCC 7102]TWH40356.1 hypothetical protein CAL7102_09671 [Dulcicalothrix desertica PCC 7102]
MRKLSVVSAFALLLVNPCLSIAATKPTQISAFCGNELQKTGYDRIFLLTYDLDSMISNGKVESSIAQINKIIDIALTSKSKSLSDDLGRLLGDDFTWRQNSHIERLIKVTPTAKKSLILAMLDNISGRIQSLDAGYSSIKIKAFAQLATIYHSLGAKEKPSILLNQAVQISAGVRLTEMRATLLTRIARTYIDIGQPTLAQKTLAQSYQVALQFDKETKDKKREFHPSHPIAYTYAELGDFERALDVAKSISNRYRQDETLGAIGGQYIKINQLEQAQELLPAIISEREKAKLLGQLAVAYSRSKNLNLADQLFNQAVKFASANILNDFYLAEIITSYAKAGQIDTASQVVNFIRGAFDKGNTRLAIATEYRKRNQLVSAKQSVETMLRSIQDEDFMLIEMLIRRAIETDNTNNNSLFNSLLIKLKTRPDILANLGRVAIQQNQLDFAYAIAQTIDKSENHEINQLFSRVAVAYANAKQPDKAIQAALKANNVDIMPYQVYGLAKTTTAFQKAGQTTLAETTFNQAIQNANALSDSRLRAVALTIIARKYNSAGQKQLGQQFLTQAIQTVKSNVAPDGKQKAELIGLILNILLETKQFDQALQVAIEFSNPELNKGNFSGIATGALQDGQDDLALKAAQFETNKKFKARSLIDIAKFQIWRLSESKGIATLDQALLVAQTIPQDSDTNSIQYTDSRASLLEEIALLYAQIGQNKQALQVAMAQNASEINRVKQRISCY